MPKEKKDFATTGTESYKLKGQQVSDKIILNIQDAKSEGVILQKDKPKDVTTGNLLLDWYHKINLFIVSHSGVKTKEKSNFYHLLSVMLNSGMPMVRALRSLLAQMDDSPRMAMIVEELAYDIERGDSLSEAMMEYDDVFQEAEIGMIESGEASGQLIRVLENLAKDAEKAHQIKSKVKGAMMYPIVVFVLLIAVVIGMMVYVIPKLTQLFESTSQELPMLTKVVVGMSDFMVNHGKWMLLLFGAFVIFFILFKRTDIGKYAWDKFKLSVPIFGKLYQKAFLSRFARSLSNLLDSNVSIVQTLEITANSIGNEVYRRRLLLSVEDMKQGIPLAENLNESDLFPPMLVNMIDVGEKTAQLDEIAAKVAAFYEDEVDTAVAGISKIIEPIILIIIGLTVGLVVAAVMLPIMQLSNLSDAI